MDAVADEGTEWESNQCSQPLEEYNVLDSEIYRSGGTSGTMSEGFASSEIACHYYKQLKLT